MPYKPKRHNADQIAAQRKEAAKAYNRRPQRRDDLRFYNGTAWRAVRGQHLMSNPLCEACEKLGRMTPGEHVHHKQDRHSHPERELDLSNLQTLCRACHSSLEAKLRGGVGR